MYVIDPWVYKHPVFAGYVRSRLLTAPLYRRSPWESVRAPAGWVLGRGAICSQATQMAASKCGIWPRLWIWSTRVRTRVGHHTVGCLSQADLWPCILMNAFLLRCRWPHWGRAAQAVRPVWPEHIALCHPQHQSCRVCASAQPPPRVKLQVGESSQYIVKGLDARSGRVMLWAEHSLKSDSLILNCLSMNTLLFAWYILFTGKYFKLLLTFFSDSFVHV